MLQLYSSMQHYGQKYEYKHSLYEELRVRRAVMEDIEGVLFVLLCPMRTTLCFRSRSPCGLRLWKRETRRDREE